MSVGGIDIDKTEPLVDLEVISGTQGNANWYVTDVTVRTNGTDTGVVQSGLTLTSCDPDRPFEADSTGFVVNGSCTDVAGNIGHALPLTLMIDQTLPTITVTPDRAPDGENGWYTAAVNVTVDGDDATSGLVGCTPVPGTLVNFDTPLPGETIEGICTDIAGNTATKSLTVKVDLTDPTASIEVTSGSEGANDWYTSDVSVKATGTDNVSGPVVCTPATGLANFETTGHTFNATCENQAGRIRRRGPSHSEGRPVAADHRRHVPDRCTKRPRMVDGEHPAPRHRRRYDQRAGSVRRDPTNYY